MNPGGFLRGLDGRYQLVVGRLKLDGKIWVFRSGCYELGKGWAVTDHAVEVVKIHSTEPGMV